MVDLLAVGCTVCVCVCVCVCAGDCIVRPITRDTAKISTSETGALLLTEGGMAESLKKEVGDI